MKKILLCGVGGQGTILAANILAEAALASGQEVKVSEIHGMAQRGGAVSTMIAVGHDVASMVIGEGEADIVIAFDKLEALRALPSLKRSGTLIVNDTAIKPLPVLTGAASMPPRAREDLAAAGALLVPAEALARAAGNPKCANVVLVGALSATLDIPAEIWERAVAERVPARTVEANLAALAAGRAFMDTTEEARVI